MSSLVSFTHYYVLFFLLYVLSYGLFTAVFLWLKNYLKGERLKRIKDLDPTSHKTC